MYNPAAEQLAKALYRQSKHGPETKAQKVARIRAAQQAFTARRKAAGGKR